MHPTGDQIGGSARGRDREPIARRDDDPRNLTDRCGSAWSAVDVRVAGPVRGLRPSSGGFHVCSANDTGHRSPSSRWAASWNSSVEYRVPNLPEFLKQTTTLPSSLA